MSMQRGRLGSRGRLQSPARVRTELGIKDGDTVILELVDGELRVRPYPVALARVQAILRKYIPEGVSLSDESIADRRAEAERE